MPSSSCLGIQVEDHVIKYAKVEKRKDSIKVEAFNTIFYENLKTTIEQIIEETDSYNVPISLNLSGEMYNYFQASSLLSLADMKKTVEIDFDMLCEERRYNKSTLETRYLFTPDPENDEKMQGIAISGNQADLTQKDMDFKNYKVSNISPISTSITNLIDANDNSNIAIINIEEETNVTVMSNGQIVFVDRILEGIYDILNKINAIENSIKKSYEVCKNTNLSARDDLETENFDNEFTEYIIPTINNLITKTKDSIEDIGINITKVYVTGLGASINNIDLYCQEFFPKAKVEILKPYFINASTVNSSIKEYIETNSAIALALNGLGYGYKELNFTAPKINTKIILGHHGKKTKKTKSKIENGKVSDLKNEFKKSLDPKESVIVKVIFSIVLILIGYIIFSIAITNLIDDKNEIVTSQLLEIDKQVKQGNDDLNAIKNKTNEYMSAIDELNKLNENQGKLILINKFAIPNLLHHLISIVPSRVRIVSIQNKTGTNTMVIEAQSEDYEQLGYLKSAIAVNQYLLNVKSTSGVKSEGIITTTIEGDLP